MTVQPIPESVPQVQVPIKELTMNKLEFGEVIFGGNLKKNLKIEANMNSTIIKEKFKQTQASSGMNLD